MINQRLFDWYNINTSKNLKIRSRCPRPFDTLLIDKNGSCFACECTSWLPQSIGNLQIQSLDDILNSKMHKHLQESITDGTYRYCNENQCSYIRSNSVLNESTTRIKHLRLAIDESCNLRCPSCRKKLIFHKQGSQYNKGIKLADKINKWLNGHIFPIQVHIGSDGDPFASHVYRHSMEHTPQVNWITYSLLTNGLLFEEFYPRIPHVINSLQELGVSIDGASKETYEKLRLGGKWDNINRNLECMANLKQKHGFRFILHFVVQQGNYHEMNAIIDLGKKYDADRVWLNKIENWNTFNDFNKENIINPAHPEHAEYIKELDSVKVRIQQSKTPPIIEIPTLNT